MFICMLAGQTVLSRRMPAFLSNKCSRKPFVVCQFFWGGASLSLLALYQLLEHSFIVHIEVTNTCPTSLSMPLSLTVAGCLHMQQPTTKSANRSQVRTSRWFHQMSVSDSILGMGASNLPSTFGPIGKSFHHRGALPPGDLPSLS